MRKFLNLFLTFLAIYLLDGVTDAHAEPVSGAILAITKFVTGLGIVGKILLSGALMVGQTLLQKAFAKKPADQPIRGVELQVRVGDDLPVTGILGTYATAGKRKYIGTWGSEGKTPNAYLVDVIEISNLPVGSITGLWINDIQCTLQTDVPGLDGRGYSIPEFISGTDDYAWWNFYTGEQVLADPYLLAKFGDHPERPWKNTMVSRHGAYIVLTYRQHEQMFPSLPSALVVTDGYPMYDVRKDSTAGGVGPHRRDDQSTWEPSDNPWVQAYAIAQGITVGGRWFYGGQNVSMKRLPTSAWIAAMNACDALRELEDGSFEPMFRSGIEFRGEDEPLKVLDYLRAASNGKLVEVGGKLKPFAGEPGAAEMAFTDADIVITKGQSFEPFPNLDDTHNGATATYPEPSEKWTNKDAPPFYNADFEEADGGRRLVASLSFPAVPYKVQVQALIRAAIEEARRFRVHQFWLPPLFWAAEPGDTLTWTSQTAGYTNKKFLLVSIEGELAYNQLVTLREIDPSDYGWSPTFQKPVSTTTPGPIPLPPQGIAGWDVQASAITDNASAQRRPAVLVTVAPDLDGVKAIRIQIRVKTTGALIHDQEHPYVVGKTYSWRIGSAALLGSQQYEVSGLVIPILPRPVVQTSWTTVTMLPLFVATADIADGSITGNKILDAAITELKLADAAVSTLKLQLGSVTQQIIANGAVIESKIQAGAVSTAKFAAGIEPVSIVAGSTVPTTKSTEVITVNGVLYRWKSGAYSAEVAAVNVSGQIVGSQIADLAIEASKLGNGSVINSKLANLSVDNAKLAALSVDASKITSNAITETKIANDAISTPKIQASAVVAGHIAAQAITASKLFISDFTNLVPDPQFEEFSWGGSAFRSGGGSAWGGPYTLGLTSPTSGGTSTGGQVFAVETGVEYYVSCKARVSAGAGPVRLRIGTGPDASAGTTYTEIGFTSSGSITDIGGKVTIPAGHYYARIVFVVWGESTGIFGAPRVRRLNGGELIVDGAITTAKLIADAVTGDKIAANSIAARQLILADFSNMVTNDFTQGNLDGWEVPGDATYGYFSTDAAQPQGGHRLRATSRNQGYSAYVTCTPGDVLYASAYTFNTADEPADLCIQVTADDGSNSTWPIVATTNTKNSWVKLEGQIVVPGGRSRARLLLRTTKSLPYSSNHTYWTKPILRRASSAELIVDGAILTNHLSANSITSVKLAANSVIAGKVAAGAISTSELASKAITAAKLAVADFTNLVPDPYMEEFSGNWFGGTRQSGGSSWDTPWLINSGVASGGAFTFANSYWFGVEPGKEYYVSCAARRTAGAGHARLQIQFADGTSGGSSVTTVEVATTQSTSIVSLGGAVTAPADRYYARVVFRASTDGTSALFGAPKVRRLNGGELIVDGAIIANHLASNSVTSAKIVAGSILATHLGAGSVTTVKLAAGAVTADKVTVANLAAISATLGAVNISNAIIGTLTVGTNNIAINAATVMEYTSVGSSSITTSGTTALSQAISHGTGSPKVRIDIAFIASNRPIQASILADGSSIADIAITANSPASYFVVHQPASGNSSTTYSLYCVSVGGNSSIGQVALGAMALKR